MKSRLTTRELEVLAYVRKDMTNKEIGRALGISAETVKQHLKNAGLKLNIPARRISLIETARQAGFISVLVLVISLSAFVLPQDSQRLNRRNARAGRRQETPVSIYGVAA